MLTENQKNFITPYPYFKKAYRGARYFQVSIEACRGARNFSKSLWWPNQVPIGTYRGAQYFQVPIEAYRGVCNFSKSNKVTQSGEKDLLVE